MHWGQWCLKKANQQNKHSDHYWGQYCSKNSLWYSEFQQQLMSNAVFEGYFHIFILVYHLQHGYDFWMMLSHSWIWMNVGKMHPPRLTVGPSALKLKCTLHRMNMGDEHHWWCQRISFHNLIRRAERNLLKRTLSIQPWAFVLQAMRCMSGWLDSFQEDWW